MFGTLSGFRSGLISMKVLVLSIFSIKKYISLVIRTSVTKGIRHGREQTWMNFSVVKIP